MHSDRINDNHMGEIWPAAHPAADANAYGSVDLSALGAFEVRSLQTFRLVYTAGPYNIDDTGALRVLFRFPTDRRQPLFFFACFAALRETVPDSASFFHFTCLLRGVNVSPPRHFSRCHEPIHGFFMDQ